jgi:hypothetical protein
MAMIANSNNTYSPHCGPIIQQPTTFPTDRPIFYNQKLEPVLKTSNAPATKASINADIVRT